MVKDAECMSAICPQKYSSATLKGHCCALALTPLRGSPVKSHRWDKWSTNGWCSLHSRMQRELESHWQC